MKKQSQLLRQSRFQLHRRRLATSWKHVALYTGLYDTMYIHTGCRTRRYAVTVGWISTSGMRRGMRRRERITNVSLLPSLLPSSSFFVRHRSLALERHLARARARIHSSGDFIYVEIPRATASSATNGAVWQADARRRDATTQRLKPRLRRVLNFFSVFLPYIPSKLSDRTKTLSRVFLPFSFQIPASLVSTRMPLSRFFASLATRVRNIILDYVITRGCC